MNDALGNQVTTSSNKIIHAINVFTTSLLQYNQDIGPLFEACKLEPENVLLNTHCAVLRMFSGDKTKALQCLNKCKHQIDKCTEREKLYYNAVLHWCKGYVYKALEIHLEIAKKYPRDLCSLFLAFNQCIFLGDFDQMMKILDYVLPYNKQDPYVLGMYCFALEENMRFKEAECVGKKACLLEEYNPWAQHSVCHVYTTVGRIDEGIEWMEKHSHKWDKCNSFMNSHNWWHLACLYLERGGVMEENNKRVLELLEKKIWINDKSWRSDRNVISGVIGLLWRMETKHMNMKSKWEEIYDSVTPRYREHFQPFYDIHYLYALAKVGDEERSKEMVDSMKQHATSLVDEKLKKSWTNVVIPAAIGLSEYAKRNYESAYTQLSSIFPRLKEIGGSNAQRKIFEQTYITTLQKIEKYDDALALLDKESRVLENRFVYSTYKAVSDCREMLKAKSHIGQIQLNTRV